MARRVPYPTFDRSRYSRKMKLVTLSVAPPGPPAVILIMMSASFSLKMMRIRIAVIETGSIKGNVTYQNPRQLPAPSTLAAYWISFGIACRPARIMILMKGIKVQPSMIIMVARATSGIPKKEGRSQPSSRAGRPRSCPEL